jgi:hypothetical protein
VQPDDSDKDPAVVLPYILGRKLGADDLYAAFGLTKSSYYDHLAKGTLTTADRLIRAARHFGINPLGLLLRYGHVTEDEVIAEVAANLGKSQARERRWRTLIGANVEISPRLDRPGL